MRKLTEKMKANLISILLLTSIMCLAGFSEMGYLELAPYRVIEVAIAPAILIAMIGGYAGAVYGAITWTLVSYFGGPDVTVEFLIANSIATLLTLLVTAIAYEMARKKHMGSPYNVYRAIIPATLTHSLAWWVLSIATGLYSEAINPYSISFLMGLFGERFIPETLFALGLMFVSIKQLRKWHILNGVKKYYVRKKR